MIGDVFQRVEIALDEGGALEQVEGEIAADAEFGKDGELGAALFGLLRKCEDAGGVAFKVADRGIELSEGYFHAD